MCEFSLQITRLLPYTNYSWWWKIFWHVYCISMCQRKNVAHKYKAEWLLWFGSAHEITRREILHHLQSLQSAPGLLHPGFFYWRWKRFAFIRSWWEGSCIYKQLVGRIFCIYERQRKTSGPFLSQAAKFANQPNSNIDTSATIFEEIQLLEKQNCVT